MRQFTKEHNDLDWLFPNIIEIGITGNSNNEFDMYENLANNYFELAHKNEINFKKDDLIDAFMKGASVAYQFINYAVGHKKYMDEKFKEWKESADKTNELIEQIKQVMENEIN